MVSVGKINGTAKYTWSIRDKRGATVNVDFHNEVGHWKYIKDDDYSKSIIFAENKFV